MTVEDHVIQFRENLVFEPLGKAFNVSRIRSHVSLGDLASGTQTNRLEYACMYACERLIVWAWACVRTCGGGGVGGSN